VTSSETIEYVQALGADEVVVRSASGIFDVVIDTVGGSALAEAYPLVRDGGRLVTLSAPPSPELSRGRDIRDEFFVVSPDRAELEQLATLVDEGTLRPLVGETFHLAEAAAAYADRGRHGGPGKTVLVIR
jgi:NADPH:quinone reductase-like Zn-dependent oxidoreductase